MTTKPRIAIVIGSTRLGRYADKAAGWMLKQTQARDETEAELLDLRDHPLPFFDEKGGHETPPNLRPPPTPAFFATVIPSRRPLSAELWTHTEAYHARGPRNALRQNPRGRADARPVGPHPGKIPLPWHRPRLPQAGRARSLVTVNGVVAAEARDRDSRGAALPVWSGCRILGNDEIFLLNRHPDSLDGRYF